MFDLPDRNELADETHQHHRKRIRALRGSDFIVEGAGPAGLVAGICVLEQGFDGFIVESSEHIGGRMTWNTDPLPLFSPADELVDDLGYTISENPPVWVDRTELLAFLAHRFYEQGGSILLQSSIAKIDLSKETDNDNLMVHMRHNQRDETFNTSNVIRTEPDAEWTTDDADSGEELEQMVRQTSRDDRGVVDAGFRALGKLSSSESFPYENASFLSGRKAAEILLSELPATPLKSG